MQNVTPNVCPTCYEPMPACGGVSNLAVHPELGSGLVCHHCDKRLGRGVTAWAGMYATREAEKAEHSPKPDWQCGRCGRNRRSFEQRTEHSAYVQPLCQRCVEEVVVQAPGTADTKSLRRVIERAMIRDDEANRRYIDPGRLRQIDADSVSAWLEAKDARIRELEAEVAMHKLNAQYNNHSRDIANAKALNEIKCIVKNLECL